MSDPHALPLDRLAAYLERELPGFRGPLAATKLAGGQSNPTYRLDAASGRYALRRKPAGVLLPSAHAVDREFRVLGALHGGDVPVAAPLHLCTDDAAIGSMFYVMAWVDGAVHADPALPGLAPDERAACYDAIVEVLAAIARVDPATIGLSDYGRPGNYYARQVARWTTQYRASETARIEAMEGLIEALPARAPGDAARAHLVHGDFRIDNLIFAGKALDPGFRRDDAQVERDDAQVERDVAQVERDVAQVGRDDARGEGKAPDPESRGAGSIAAVVDWELSTLGDPRADLATFCMALRLPPNPVVPGLAGVDRAALGIPSEDAIVERWCARTGIDARPDWPFLLAFNFFRLAAIAQGVAKRAEQGNASSPQARAAGRMVGTVAALGAALL